MTVPRKQGTCKKHGTTAFFWHTDKRRKAGGGWECVACGVERSREYGRKHPERSTERYHRLGLSRPMAEAKDCSLWLGVHIAERILSKYFDNLTRMPPNNPGYDYICGRGYKIDVKSSCLIADKGHGNRRWVFNTCKNQTADYFLCLAFDNRESLQPLHIWLIPASFVRGNTKFSVMGNSKGVSKWAAYERPIDRVLECCEQIKAVV